MFISGLTCKEGEVHLSPEVVVVAVVVHLLC